MINPSLRPSATRWTREQIRAARLAPLLPLLQKRNLQLLERGGGNYLLPAFPGLIIKDSYLLLAAVPSYLVPFHSRTGVTNSKGIMISVRVR